MNNIIIIVIVTSIKIFFFSSNVVQVHTVKANITIRINRDKLEKKKKKAPIVTPGRQDNKNSVTISFFECRNKTHAVYIIFYIPTIVK